MVKTTFFDLIDKKFSGDASGEELLELVEMLESLLPEKKMEKEEIEKAWLRMIRKMKSDGILF